METLRGELVAYPLLIMLSMLVWNTVAQDDFSGPIKCYYCFGDARNSSCSDPIYPRTEKSKNLEVIECERGICLKWTYFYQDKLFMHRTCSERHDFKIMMIDGVCRSERDGNGYLCMCGKHLCNAGTSKSPHTLLVPATLLLLVIYSVIRNNVINSDVEW